MKATVLTPEMTTLQPAPGRSRPSLTGKMYRYHGFRVLDAAGECVGQVDWIWANETEDQAEFLGVQLQWLRGKARAIPANDVAICAETSTIRVGFRKDEIARAPRFSIGSTLTADQKRAIRFHYRPGPAVVVGRAIADRLVA